MKSDSVSVPLMKEAQEKSVGDVVSTPQKAADIDSLAASLSRVALSPEFEKTIKQTPEDDDDDAYSSAATTSDDDEESEGETTTLDSVTASYIESMKAILSSLDKSLSAVKEEKTKAAEKPPAAKKEDATPVPRMLVNGQKATVEIKDSKAPASPRNSMIEKKIDGESTPTRRRRSRTNPNTEEGHIVRSSRTALPQRRFMPEQVEAVPYNFMPNMTNDFSQPELTIDDLLKNAQGGYIKTQPNLNDFYGFDLASPINMDLQSVGAGLDAGYGSFSAASTPDLIDCGLDSLAVYSSPPAPLTPPSATYSINHLSSPYGTPQEMFYTPQSLSYGNDWSSPSSAVSSPPQQSFSPQQPTSHGLQHQSVIAMKQHILLPLAQDYTLMQYAPLIAAASHRLDEGRIVCVRDLEKYLLFKSQEMCPSPQAYIDFMERFFIRCQTALPFVEAAGGELTRRNETPYYDGYFMDILAQYKSAAASQAAPVAPVMVMKRNSTDNVHQHKSSLSQQMSRGITSNHRMSIGRVGKNQSVSHRPTASISAGMHEQILAAVMQQASQDVKLNLGFDDSSFNGIAFPLSPESEDQGANDDNSEEDESSSGLPRRKNRPSASKPQGGHVCMHRDDDSGTICGKKYNRPCDLKKHGKTHSRPHKCSEQTCLYHEKGFPTEKERDRHETDRHSDAPTMFHCEFPPCPYKSKRESNCKQHMEKQHDYVYERSKHNPRNPNGNADIAKRSSLSKASPMKPMDGMQMSKTEGMMPYTTGMQTPPNDLVSSFFPTQVSNDMPQLHNMYLTPSPESSQTFRSGSVSTTADGDVAFGDNWGQYNAWPQPMMTNNNAYGFGMASAE